MFARPACLTAPSDVWTSSGAASSSPAAITARADSRLKTLNPPRAQPSRRALASSAFGFTSIALLLAGSPALRGRRRQYLPCAASLRLSQPDTESNRHGTPAQVLAFARRILS